MDEFALIETVFAPLAPAGAPAFGLGDDAAVLTPPPGTELVLTKDMMVSGRHFLDTEAPQDVARKLLRVNLSDLAAMGAEPLGYLLGLAFADRLDESLARKIAAGLALDQETFGCVLIGGDTISGAGRLLLSLTAVGAVPKGQALRRSGAQGGDLVAVSGTLGDAALGLRMLRGELPPDTRLIARHRLPEPRLVLGQALRGLASAAIDISDGFAADLGHICTQSGVGAEIDAACLPLSDAARALLEADACELAEIVTGGDDYELVITLPPERHKDMLQAATVAGVPVSVVGRIVDGDDVRIHDASGMPMHLGIRGFRHK